MCASTATAARLKRDFEDFVDFTYKSENGAEQSVRFTNWVTLLKYQREGVNASTRSLNLYWAKDFAGKIEDSLKYKEDPDINDKTGVYEWSVWLKRSPDLTKEERFVFYVGKASAVRGRIFQERLGKQGGIFEEFLTAAFEYATSFNPDAELEFQVSAIYAYLIKTTRTTGRNGVREKSWNEFDITYDKMEKALLNKYDYAANDENNPPTRLPDFKNWLYQNEPGEAIKKLCKGENVEEPLSTIGNDYDTLDRTRSVLLSFKRLIEGNGAVGKREALIYLLNNLNLVEE